jgi:hypothetical protein
MAKMTTQAKKPRQVVERNLALTEKLMSYLLAQPRLLNSLPESFELVILPDDDPELRLYNLNLLDTYGSEGKPVVFARLESSRRVSMDQVRPNLYVPLAA